MYDIEKIVEVTTVDDAIKALVADPSAKIIAGGTDVLVQVREGRHAGCSLVSIGGIKELKGVSIEDDGTIIIRPLTTFTSITYNPVIQKHIPTLGYAADQVGGPQIRNMGTVGGNISNGVTSADTATTLFVLNAVLEITGPGGTRELAIADYYTGPGRVALENGEILTAIKITKDNYDGYTGHYIKYAMRNAMDIATLGCSVACKVNGDILEDLRIAFGVAGPVPMRCTATEKSMSGKKICDELFAEISESVLLDINPRTSWRATKEFRIQLASELSKRAVAQAVAFAKGE